MSHPHTPSHSAHASASSPFRPEEVEAFQTDDKGAATAIVCLMAGIFTLGLVGYLIVCYWVA